LAQTVAKMTPTDHKKALKETLESLSKMYMEKKTAGNHQKGVTIYTFKNKHPQIDPSVQVVGSSILKANQTLNNWC
jgi:hypothetical protein